MRYFIISIFFVFTSCISDKEEGKLNRLSLPSHFPKPVYNFEENPYSYDGFVLGRKLFFDPLLSVNNTVSCGTCHAAEHAFADHNIRLSTGVFEREGKRNSPPVFNMLWNKSFMWDGGINHIEVMPVAPITDHNEMAETMANVVNKLKDHPEYPLMFEKAFGTDQIDDRYLLLALAQFMGAIISANTRYDQYVLGKIKFTEDEKAGMELFRTHCESCHKEPLFTDYSFRNNGLDTEFKDKGRMRITENEEDLGKFKIPTLRNVMLTYPYMHDGRFNNIDEVLNHYSSGVKDSPTLDPLLKGGISLDTAEKEKIKVFLRTLSDYELIVRNEFKDPFQQLVK